MAYYHLYKFKAAASSNRLNDLIIMYMWEWNEIPGKKYTVVENCISLKVWGCADFPLC